MQVSEITAFLEHAYDVLNREWFGGELPRAVITVQSSPKAYGYITVNDVWFDTGIGYREINIGAENLDRPIENVIATLVHEQTHFWNSLHGIKDTSRSGTYHSRRFKESAEAHGLIIEYSPKIGYSLTAPSPALIAFIEEQGWTGISLARNGGLGASGGAAGKKKSSTRKYIELIKINQEIDNLVEAVASAGVTAAKRYNAKIEKLDKASERISKEILDLKTGTKALLTPEEIQDCIDSWEQYSFDKKKTIAKLFIKAITITDDEIEIIFN